MSNVVSTSSDVSVDSMEFDLLLSRMTEQFSINTNTGSKPVFRTNVEDLFSIYLEALPQENRQYHTCNSCRNFLNRFGSLVTIDSSGKVQSAIWEGLEAPAYYAPAVAAMLKTVRNASVIGVFLSKDSTLGMALTSEWTHLHVNLPKIMSFRNKLLEPSQVEAEKLQDYITMVKALKDFSLDAVNQAVALLKTDNLYRSEKLLGVAEWLQSLHEARNAVKSKQVKDNLLWQAVASAPIGFSHPRSSMIGTLLEDTNEGLSFETIQKRFSAKMNPLQYQRPQAAPTAGNIAQAEKIFDKLGLASSLRRRFARLDEIEALWKPTELKRDTSEGGIFANITPKGSLKKSAPIDQPTITMTWEKFSRAVLPEALSIEFFVPTTDNFVGLTTAADPYAPPLLQWDQEHLRNPVAWYVYNAGSSAFNWGLTPNSYCNVTAITYQPSMWTSQEEKYKHHGKSVIFVLDSAEDKQNHCLALFPECLKAELHSVRATIEAYSLQMKLEPTEGGPLANGIRITTKEASNKLFRVTTKSGVLSYKIDRWD